ncbi:carboxypeptidase D isoform X2 [Anopheles stephensi]|uniref:carboxypeptidase D isoform X2 n=1 Tax=Anopheles stephensi TaxID=30069 RepID=UPI0016589F37|nr:carboxypeptidase D isoform X2 [Anopheles stephensi]
MGDVKLYLLVSAIAINCCLSVLTVYGYTVQNVNPVGGSHDVDESFLQQPHYRGNNELLDVLAHLQKDYPDLAKVHTIGQSLEGRPLTVVEIRPNVNRPRPLLMPMFKYVGNMHGDETVGRELLLYLAQYLLANYGRDPEVSSLVNETAIYLMPTMNPDGYERSKEGVCESPPDYVGRYNAANVDLNRDFPDRFDDERTRHQRMRRRQPETVAVMNWILNNPFVLSANLHGGAVVASYPYDNSIHHHDCCEESRTPDNKFFKYAALTYAENHPVMRQGRDCNETFQSGITNGAYWYELSGGMQDFNYVYSNCFEVTLELSCCKFPYARELPNEWHKNKRSLIEYLKLVHVGVKGLVTDSAGYPIKDADVIVSGIDRNVRTSERGEYWRLLVPGQYNVRVEAVGYYPSEPVTVQVKADQPLQVNFSLKSYDTQEAPSKSEQVRVVRETFDEYGFAKTPAFVHHNYTSMVRYIQDLATNYPSITQLYSIGKSVQGRDLWVMEVTANPGKHVPGKPEVKYIANMHGNEVVGRELLLLFAKYLCENFNRTQRITRLVNGTRLHLLFSMNPDGYELADANDKESLRGRSNANNVDLNRNFPDQFGRNHYNTRQEPETLAVMNWSLATPFVLSANLHGGALVANYPFDDSPKDFAYSSGYGDPRTVKNPTEENELFQYLAHVYANSHTTMHLGHPCRTYLRETFPDGITNGAAWYSVTGGMQDWSYVVGGAYELTLEVGCDKFPPASQLPDFWKQNREALLQYVEQAQHGITGYVRSTIGHPIGRASVKVNQIEHVTYTTANGDYYRLLLPGLYNVTAEAEGYEPQSLEVRIPPEADRAVIVDFQLMRDDPQHWSSAYDYRTLENVIKTRYHSDAELKSIMAEFENKYYTSVSLEFGGNEVSMAYPSVKVTDSIGEPEETKLHILIISSLFQTTAIGREMVINLARHVLAGYVIKEPLLIKLLQNAVLHFVPVKNDFDEIVQQFRANGSVCNPTLHSDELADKLLNAETDNQKDMFLRMLKDEEYDLALTFSAGGHDVFFPNTDDKVAVYSRFAEKIKGHKYRQSANSDHCTVDAGQLHQVEATQRVTNAIHKLYEVPLFTLQLGCCKMPAETAIASVWRQNLERMTNFLRLIDTGIRGFVKNAHGAPLRKAILRVHGNNLIYKVTPNLAHFRIILPSGSMEIEISCYNYTSRIMPVTLSDNQILDLGDIVMQEAARPRESIVAPPVPVLPQTLLTPEKHRDFGVLEPSKTMKVFPQDGGVEVNAVVSGIVLDDANHPLPNAKVYVTDANTQKVLADGRTGPLGKFQFESLSDTKDIMVHAEPSGYEQGVKQIRQGPLGGATGIVFHLARDERVLGLPRLVFVILAGCVSVGIIVAGIMCFMYIQARRRDSRYYYNFSLLPQKGEPNRKLFDDDEETELFRASTKKLQPYYDDEREPITDTDDDSEEEIVMLNPSFRNTISQS